ncbi:MAG: gamma-glutamylcyclotransferase family protein [Thermodesulfobacteriota bacterium]
MSVRPAAIFTYGTLTFPDVMQAVTGRTFASLPATLAGYACRAVRGAVYPGAVQHAGATTDGVLWQGVDETSLARLDRFEGELYERREVTVVARDGARHAAQVYVVRAAHASRLAPEPWDRERFAREHLAAYLSRCRAGPAAAEDDG